MVEPTIDVVRAIGKGVIAIMNTENTFTIVGVLSAPNLFLIFAPLFRSEEIVLVVSPSSREEGGYAPIIMTNLEHRLVFGKAVRRMV